MTDEYSSDNLMKLLPKKIRKIESPEIKNLIEIYDLSSKVKEDTSEEDNKKGYMGLIVSPDEVKVLMEILYLVLKGGTQLYGSYQFGEFLGKLSYKLKKK